MFVASVGVLALLAYGGLNQATGLKDQSFDGLWRLWAARLPIAVALVWLALHSGREAALAQRLEEDYGYKAAVAASFVGFNAQMKQIDEQVRPDSPLAKLCADTLGTIASPPGRIYDKHQLTHTPADQLKALIESAIDRARANVSPQSK